MAISAIVGCFGGQNKASGTTLVVSTIGNQPSSGDLVLLAVAADNTGTGAAATCSVSSTGITWTAFAENPIITPGKAAAGGAVLYMFWGIATGNLGTVTITFGTAITAKACAAQYIRSDGNGFGSAVAHWRASFSSDAGPAPSAIAFSVASGQAWWGTTAVEGLTGDASRFHGTVDNFQFYGTSGSGSASNMSAFADASACAGGGGAPLNETSGSYNFTSSPVGDSCMAITVIKEHVVATNADAIAATGSGAAQQPGGTVSEGGTGNSTATAAAQQAQGKAGAAPQAITGSSEASAPTTKISTVNSDATGTATANDATISTEIDVQAGEIAASASAYDTTIELGVTAYPSEATGTGSSADLSAKIAPRPIEVSRLQSLDLVGGGSLDLVAGGTLEVNGPLLGAASAPETKIEVPAADASGSLAAYDTTIDVVSNTLADAGDASGTAESYGCEAAVALTTMTPDASGAASDATTTIDFSIGEAAGSGSAQGLSTSTDGTALTAEATVAANQPSTAANTEAQAEAAELTGSAADATVEALSNVYVDAELADAYFSLDDLGILVGAGVDTAGASQLVDTFNRANGPIGTSDSGLVWNAS